MKAMLVFAGAAVVLLLFHDTLIIAFGGLLTAVLLDACIDTLLRRVPMKRSWALAAIIVLGLGIAAAVVAYGGRVVLRQYAALQVALPAAVREAAKGGAFGGLLPVDPGSIQSVAAGVSAIVARASGMLSSTLALVVSVGVMLFVGVCIAAEPELYRRGLVSLFPREHQLRVDHLLDAVGGALRAWLVARLVSMVAIAVLSGIGLTALGIPYSIALALLAGVLAFVPNVGAFVAGVPSVLLALAISPQRAVLVVLMYWLAHALDDFLLIPIAERRIVHLPPALTILVQIGLGGLLGVLGVTFAAPLTATAIVAIRTARKGRAQAA